MISTFNVSDHDRCGKVLFSHRVSPVVFSGTRVKAESALWSRWRPLKMVFRFACGGPTTGGGTLAIAWNPDPDYVIQNDSTFAVNAALAAQSNVIVRLDTIGSFAVPCTAVSRWLLTDLTAEIGAHGTVFAVLVSPPSGVHGSISVVMTLDWSIQWNGAELSDLNRDPGQATIYPDEGWYPVFTTSDSAFDSTVLTFKNRSGGSMVPWQHAMPGVVYTVASGSKVPYKNSDDKDAEAKWFSLVLNYPTRGLLLHASEQNARDYQRTGNLDYALKYKAAGGYSTPQKLALVAVPRVKSVQATTPANSDALQAILMQLGSITERLDRLELKSDGYAVE